MKRSLLIILMTLSLILCAYTLVGSAAPAKTALFIGVMDPNDSDAAVIERLGKLGFKVTQVDHASCGDENPLAYALVVISSTSTSGNILDAGTYVTSATPTLHWESALMDDYKYAVDLGAYDYDPTEYVVKDTSHPVMAGLSKTFTPFADANNLHSGVAEAGRVLALLPDDKAAVIVAEKGDKLLDGFVAPGRRAYIASGDNAWVNATADGWKLFDQLVAWLTVK